MVRTHLHTRGGRAVRSLTGLLGVAVALALGPSGPAVAHTDTDSGRVWTAVGAGDWAAAYDAKDVGAFPHDEIGSGVDTGPTDALAPDPDADSDADSAAYAGSGSVWYVDPLGSDTGPGSQARPWRSIARAVRTAPPGATISVAAGSYAPFTITRPGQTVASSGDGDVVVTGAAGVQDVVRIAARDVTLAGLTVTGCVPNSSPRGGFEENGSSGVRIDAAATDVTVRDTTVRDSRSTNDAGLPFGCYGIFVRGADGSRLLDNDISGNGAGIYFNGGGRGAQVVANRIHDNDVIIRNTRAHPNDDFGASAIAFTNLTSSPGPTATANVISGNAGPSSDYETDGGAFEIYNASHLRIHGNTLDGNENVLETGTGAGGACVDNTFTGNTATGRPPGGVAWSKGLILRCATGMQITGNDFLEVDWWVFVVDTGDEFSTGVRGLTIADNTIAQWQKVYHLGVDPVAEDVTIDGNRLHFTGPVFASYADGTTSSSVAEWRERTGLDLTSTEY